MNLDLRTSASRQKSKAVHYNQHGCWVCTLNLHARKGNQFFSVALLWTQNRALFTLETLAPKTVHFSIPDHTFVWASFGQLAVSLRALWFFASLRARSVNFTFPCYVGWQPETKFGTAGGHCGPKLQYKSGITPYNRCLHGSHETVTVTPKDTNAPAKLRCIRHKYVLCLILKL